MSPARSSRIRLVFAGDDLPDRARTAGVWVWSGRLGTKALRCCSAGREIELAGAGVMMFALAYPAGRQVYLGADTVIGENLIDTSVVPF